jgi:hypothetical protein
MLQRIQSVYLLIAVLSGATFYYIFSPADYIFGLYYYWGMVVAVTGWFAGIFLYKRRPVQILLNNLMILLVLILIGLRIYEAVASGGTSFSKKDAVWLLPVLSIVFVKLANKAIQRDESLVKSVDRIR